MREHSAEEKQANVYKNALGIKHKQATQLF